MITYKLHLIRAGRATEEDWKGYVGQWDPALREESAEELEELRRRFRYPRVEMVYTSSLQRAVQTADILYPDLYTVEMDGLMDMGLGRFEGRTFEELRDDPDLQAWLKNSAENPPPGGEKVGDFTRRIIASVQAIFHRMMEERMTSVAAVTHGGVIMSLLAGICLPKRPLDQWSVGHGTGYTLLFTPQMWMRDGCAEVLGPIPEAELPEDFEDEESGDW